MEYIENASTVKDLLNSEKENNNEEIIQEAANMMGVMVAGMHAIRLTHGDLTTANFLINNTTKEMSVIDFGLGALNSSIEDMAVDLYVLERAFACTHPHLKDLVHFVLGAYEKAFHKDTKAVLKKLDEVRMRGRKRTMLG